MQTIPLQAVPNQTVFVSLNNQSVQLNVYQKLTGMFMDVLLNDSATSPLVGVLCRNQCFCVMDYYLGFSGDLMWVDTQGLNADPVYTGVGARFQLVYLLPSDVPASALFAGSECQLA